MQRIVSRLTGAVVCVGLLALVGAAGASARNPVRGAGARERTLHSMLASGAVQSQDDTSSTNHIPDNDEADESGDYDFERTAPAQFVSGQALISAQQQAQGLGEIGPDWQQFTTQPYNAEPAGYDDPLESNAGAGFGIVGGRVTALITAPDGSWFAGTADGGVWRSRNQGQTWTPVFDSMPSLSIGALTVDPVDGSIWVGTGEANLSSDSYAGTGIYRSTNDGRSWQRIGDNSNGTDPIVSTTVFRIIFDQAGDALAATDNGLFRLAAHSNAWTPVLEPAGANDNPPYDQQVTSVAFVPGTRDRQVIAAIGWHGPGNTENNGFYQSNNGGLSFSKVTITGAINASDVGRTTFAYSADGTKLYAIVQSVSELAAGDETSLLGIFVSTGSPASVAGPWVLIGDEDKLAASGSALPVGSGYGVGIQAWYNQDLAVDPNNPNHVYAGLEEVFESSDGGNTWNTASPYWNYGLACNNTAAGCPNTTHPDQHAMMISDGKIVIGNDGGVYSRPLSDNQQYGGWADLNSTLSDWQYYDARAGLLGSWGNGVGVWGGLQDNGTSFDFTGARQMIEPAGGDGFDVIVPPTNAATTMVGEYAYGLMYSTTDGGHTFDSYITPMCIGQEESLMPGAPLPGCDPNSRFQTPMAADQNNGNTWVAGGEDVWITKAGWNTTCTTSSCSWQNLFDTGAGNVTTAITSADNGRIIYDGWVTNGNPGPTFNRGIATNYGGTWHQLDVSSLPDRYIAGITVDPRDPARAWVVFNGYSRRWIPGGGVGHVFETENGGQSWTDISGNLPDIASDALVQLDGRLALATDSGAYTAWAGQGSHTRWSRLGTGLPNASLNNITVGPQGYLYAATHGRGVWRIPFGNRAGRR
jgi:sugar lactone lactonase YvrE